MFEVVVPLIAFRRRSSQVLLGTSSIQIHGVQYRAAGISEALQLHSLWSISLIAPQKRACIASATAQFASGGPCIW